MDYSVPTVRIKAPKAEGGYIVINQTDFDHSQHELYEGPDAAPTPPPAPEPVKATDVAKMSKAEILKEAESMGVRLDGRLSEDKLRATLADLKSEEK